MKCLVASGVSDATETRGHRSHASETSGGKGGGWIARGSVALVDVGELPDHAHHPGEDLPRAAAVAEDGVELAVAAAVEAAVPLALVAADGVDVLEPHLWADDLVQHAQHRRVVDQHGRGAARHLALGDGQGPRIVALTQHLVADGGDLLSGQDGLAHQVARQVEAARGIGGWGRQYVPALATVRTALAALY